MQATEIITLEIQAKGEIVSSNFPAFAEMVRARLGEINRDLTTDADFDQADADAKAIAGAEASLKAAKEKALADAEQLHALFEGIDGLTSELSRARLDLAGQIKKRKEEVKAEIVESFLAEFDIDPAAARRQFLKGLQESVKGKKNVESMKDACRIYQKGMQAGINESRASIAKFEAKFGADLTMDKKELELKGREAVEAELVRRHEAKLANAEKARLQKIADDATAEAAKAKAALVESSKPAEASAPVKAATAAPVATEPATGQTEHEEWAEFRATCIAAFQASKAKREGLKHSKNTAKAAGLANAFNAAWKEWA